MKQRDGMLRNSSRAPVRRRLVLHVAVSLGLAWSLSHVSAQQPGKNVNLVSGTEWPGGDPFLNKQNEPYVAVSTRNVRHLVAGANDYRTVDLPGLPTDKPTGDAWLGLFKSLDGGQTWTSTLIPGYPQDDTLDGLASPLKGYDAGADPVVRAGSNGLFYYAGIVFDRGALEGAASEVAAPVSDAGTRRSKGKPSRAESAKDRREAERVRENERDRAREREKERERASGTAAAVRKRLQSLTARERKERLEELGGQEKEAGADSRRSAIFVSTFLDLNHLEAGDPIAYVRTTLVDSDEGGLAGGRFLDKQWTAVDIPRQGASTCRFEIPQPEDAPTIIQEFPGGRVYVAYTAFTGSGPSLRGQIMLSYSSDCGQTWSRPRDISTTPDPDLNDDGIVTTADLNVVRASFGRRCGQLGFNAVADINQDCVVNVLDLSYVSRSVGQPVGTARRVPQGASIAIHPTTGAVHVAWREFAAGGLPNAILVARSTDFGATFSPPVTVSPFNPFDQGTTETSFRSSAFPTIAADTERLYLAWSARGYGLARPDPLMGDARIVISTSQNGVTWTPPQRVDDTGQAGHQLMPVLSFGGGKLFLLYYDLREDVSRLFQQYIDEFDILTLPAEQRLRHTVDVRIAQANPGPQPLFTSRRLSEYAFGLLEDTDLAIQLQYNPPNLTLFQGGRAAFMGDYVGMDVSPSIVLTPQGQWVFDTAPSTNPGGYAVWTDNRNVRPANGNDFTVFTPPNSSSRTTMSRFDPAQQVPTCIPDQTGTRNQDIFGARFDQGLFVTALGNQKPLDAELQRAFALLVENTTTDTRSYRLTIENQPPGGQASFLQFGAPLTTLDLSVPRFSSAARTVYVTSNVPDASITIDVAEIEAPGAPDAIVGGLAASVVLNGDPTAPRIENPRIENPRIENRSIESEEVYNVKISPAIEAPRIENPRIENIPIEVPRIENVTEANQNIANPRIENSNPGAPRIENPRIENPRIENSTLTDGAITDTTWEITNDGNTAAVYALKMLLGQELPEGFAAQLIVHKSYTTPAADGCTLRVVLHNNVLLNITTPEFADPNDLGTPRIENPRIENATIALAPGDTAQVTLRVFDPIADDAVTFSAAAAVTPAAVQQAVNSEDVANGVTEPPVVIAVTVTTASLPDALNGDEYPGQLAANVAGTWSQAGGTVPPGLVLLLDGSFGGATTTAGSYTFTVLFTPDATPTETVTREFTIRVVDALNITSTGFGSHAEGVPFNSTIAAAGGIPPYSFSVTGGTLPPGLLLSIGGVLDGTPSATGVYSVTVRVEDSSVPARTDTQEFGFTIVPQGPTDVFLDAFVDVDPVDQGDTLTYTVEVSNLGGTNAATGVVATFAVPPSATFLSVDTIECALAGALITCHLNTLFPSTGVTFEIAVRPEVGGVTLIAPVEVTSSTVDSDLSNNSITVSTTVTGDGSRRLWVANGDTSDSITIIDPDTNAAVGSFALADPAYDVEFSPNGERAYVASLAGDYVKVYDTTTLSEVDSLSVNDPARIEFSPDGSRVYVIAEGGSVEVFNGVTHDFITSIPVGSAPYGAAVSPDGLYLYVANRGSDTLSLIDTSTNAVSGTITLASGDFPTEVVVSPNGQRIYVSNGLANTVSVLSTVSNAFIDVIDVGLAPQGIAISPDGTRVYVANFSDDTVSVIDTSTNTVIATPSVSGSPNGIVVSPDGTAVYVTAYNEAAIRVIDTATNTVEASEDTGSLPIAVDYVRIKP
jgi:uncharacterized repeat protein (TIGR01451 family)